MLPYTQFLGNKTRVQYGKIQDWYIRMIFYKYILMYWTIVNTFGLLWPMHANMRLQCLMTQHMRWMCNFTFCHLIGVNCILYMAQDRVLQVSDVLIYLAVIRENVVCTIRQFNNIHQTREVRIICYIMDSST